MRKKNPFTFLIALAVLLMLSDCASPAEEEYPNHQQLVNREAVEMEIVKSLLVPFKTSDTLVLETDSVIWRCGNSSDEELKRMRALFIPSIYKKPYLDTFAKHYAGHILLHNHHMNAKMDSLLHVLPDTITPWDYLTKNKTIMSLRARVLSPKSFELYEHYSFNNNTCYITRMFTWSGQKWSWKITDRLEEIEGQVKKTNEMLRQEEAEKKLLEAYHSK